MARSFILPLTEVEQLRQNMALYFFPPWHAFHLIAGTLLGWILNMLIILFAS